MSRIKYILGLSQRSTECGAMIHSNQEHKRKLKSKDVWECWCNCYNARLIIFQKQNVHLVEIKQNKNLKGNAKNFL